MGEGEGLGLAAGDDAVGAGEQVSRLREEFDRLLHLVVTFEFHAETFGQTEDGNENELLDLAREPVAVSYTHLTLPTNREV